MIHRQTGFKALLQEAALKCLPASVQEYSPGKMLYCLAVHALMSALLISEVVNSKLFVPTSDGDRLSAYTTYQVAINLLETGSYTTKEDILMARSLASVLAGNMAVMCLGISHGTVIQVQI